MASREAGESKGSGGETLDDETRARKRENGNKKEREKEEGWEREREREASKNSGVIARLRVTSRAEGIQIEERSMTLEICIAINNEAGVHCHPIPPRRAALIRSLTPALWRRNA